MNERSLLFYWNLLESQEAVWKRKI